MKKNILLVVILVVVMASFVACNNAEAVEPVASEPASSSEEVSEPASEEMSSEEVSEEVSEEEVVEIDLSKFTNEKGKRMIDLVKAMKYNELKIAVWGANGAEAILSDGDSFIEEDNSNVYDLVFPKPVKEVKINNADIIIEEEKYYAISPYTAEDAYDVTCEVTYEDGTTETITVNITVFK